MKKGKINRVLYFLKRLLHYTIFFPHEASCTYEDQRCGAEVGCVMCGKKTRVGDAYKDDGSVWYITVSETLDA